jgi:hypothetical protein
VAGNLFLPFAAQNLAALRVATSDPVKEVRILYWFSEANEFWKSFETKISLEKTETELVLDTFSKRRQCLNLLLFDSVFWISAVFIEKIDKRIWFVSFAPLYQLNLSELSLDVLRQDILLLHFTDLLLQRQIAFYKSLTSAP